jgi:ABC-type transport system involved in multi-copper enzyme maturation permease subunit
MFSDLGDNARGIYIITKRELRSHIKSLRMVILMVLFVLAILGGAYGMSALSIQSDIVKSPEVVGWVFKVAADDDGLDNDLLIYFTDVDGVPVDGVDYKISYKTKTQEAIISERENAPAKTFVKNVNKSSRYTIYHLQASNMEFSKGDYTAYRMFAMVWISVATHEFYGSQYYMASQVLDLDEENRINDAIIMVIDTKTTDFEPVASLKVTLGTEDNPYSNVWVNTNENGVCVFHNLDAGTLDPVTFQTTGENYIFSAEYTINGTEFETSTGAELIYDLSLADLFKTDNPNQVLAFVALMFITYLGPLTAVVLAFDSISKERLQNSLDFLLSRPVSRRSIAAGKLFGTFLAIAIPVTVINVIGIFIIWGKTGNMPDTFFSLAFLVFTLAFIAIYVILAQIFSTIMKSTATAILSVISIFLIFVLFWGLIALAINSLLGNSLGSDEYLIFNNRFSLFSPNGIYQLLIIMAIPGSTASDYVGVSSWMAYLVLGLWLVGGFIIAIELFNRRMRNY